MKILYHHRTLGDGAEGIHIKEMVSAFRLLGHKVKVIGPVGEVAENKVSKKVSLLSRLKSRVPPLFYEILEVAYNVYGYLIMRKEILREKPDFIYDRYMIFNASCVLIGKRYGIPVFLEVNAPLALERYEQPDEKLYLKRLAFFLEKWICSNSFRTIAVSTPLKNYLVSIGVPDKRILVMPNGVDPEKFKPKGEKNEELLRKCGFCEEDIIIGFLGILRPWHGIEILLDAFRQAAMQIKNLKLLIIGDGPIRFEIEQRIQRLGIHEKVYISGTIPHTIVPHYVNLFDIAISPKATFYSSPMKILEYMALRKAVIAPNTKNIRDILTNGVDGLLFSGSHHEELKKCIIKLAQNLGLRRKLGEAARKKIIEKRNWKNIAQLISQMGSKKKA